MKAWKKQERLGRVCNIESNMANHQNKNTELEKFNQAQQEFWLSALMHSPDIEQTYHKLRQSIIETHQSMQKYLDDTQKEVMSESLSLTANMSELEKEELLKETREVFLEINKSIGMDEQGSKAKLEQQLTELENIKNQVIKAKQMQKKRMPFMIIIVIFLLIISFYFITF